MSSLRRNLVNIGFWTRNNFWTINSMQTKISWVYHRHDSSDNLKSKTNPDHFHGENVQKCRFCKLCKKFSFYKSHFDVNWLDRFILSSPRLQTCPTNFAVNFFVKKFILGDAKKCNKFMLVIKIKNILAFNYNLTN